MELCFGAKIRKILGIPLHTKVLLPYIKVGFEGIYFTQTCYPDVNADLYLLLETGNIREFWGTSIFPVSLDSICGVNGFQQGSNSFCGLGKNICATIRTSHLYPQPLCDRG